MKLQYFNGGLGNQLFQYIFYRYFEIHTGGEIWLDDLKFHKVHEHNGYELERVFGVRPRLISTYFDADVWEYIVECAKAGKGDLAQQMLDMGTDLAMVAETQNYIFNGTVHQVPTNGFYPEIVQIPGNIYYFGYWINKHWLAAIREMMMKELVFPPIEDAENLAYLRLIESRECVSVHIRRGDFCKLGFDLPPQFYREALANMAAALPGATYLIFSDDLGWCEEHATELGFSAAEGNLVYVSGNAGEKSYIDMDLMSRCRGMILANSAFSYFAGLYNARYDKVIINPSRFREV